MQNINPQQGDTPQRFWPPTNWQQVRKQLPKQIAPGNEGGTGIGKKKGGKGKKQRLLSSTVQSIGGGGGVHGLLEQAPDELQHVCEKPVDEVASRWQLPHRGGSGGHSHQSVRQTRSPSILPVRQHVFSHSPLFVGSR